MRCWNEILIKYSDKLNELNKLQAGSAISMLKNQVMKNQSLPRSTSLIDSSISSSTNGGNSVRSWKQVRTRGLSNTTSFATPEDGATTRPSLSNMVYSSYNDFDNEINIDLDVSTEVSHSILDILEEIHNIHSKTDQWHYEFSLILVELVLTNQCSICSILRGLKLFRNVISTLLDTFLNTSLLAAFCMKIPSLMVS